MRMPLGAQRGAQAFPPPPLAPLELPVFESYIYWEINTPRGASFKPPTKHSGGGRGSRGPSRNTDPGPSLKTRGDWMGEKARDTGAF